MTTVAGGRQRRLFIDWARHLALLPGIDHRPWDARAARFFQIGQIGAAPGVPPPACLAVVQR
ncbi:MAG: hypothetical protein NVS2B9_04220 [Myxococcales bacterium]